MAISNKELISKAASKVKSRRVKDYLIGDVGCALESSDGKLYFGVCASLDSNTFCAEKIAIGSMLTAGKSEIKKIVAVWKDEKGDTFVIPPCGNCRELIKQVNQKNLDTKVLLDFRKTVDLRELLPYFDSWKKVKV